MRCDKTTTARRDKGNVGRDFGGSCKKFRFRGRGKNGRVIGSPYKGGCRRGRNNKSRKIRHRIPEIAKGGGMSGSE